MDYAKHVAKLAKANRVKVVFVSDFYDCAGWIAERKVYILPVIDERTYAIAMHELGHVLGPMQAYHSGIGKGTFADAEIGAWLWAKANTQFWMTGMQKTLKKCLQSYNNYPHDGRFKIPAACPDYRKLF